MTPSIQTLSKPEVINFLSSHTIGRMSYSLDGVPYCIPLAYVYFNDALYGQTTKGEKTTILMKNSNVCFLVDELEPTGWKSVVCWGTFETLVFSELKTSDALLLTKALSEHLHSIQDQVGIDIQFGIDEKNPTIIQDTNQIIFRIPITKISGKRFIR